MDLGNIDSRLLIFGGPYSNLTATQAMQARAEALGITPEQIICTGDLVAYCGEPCETVELIRAWGVHVLMGNCEQSLGFEQADCGCGFDQEGVCSLLSIDWYRYADQMIYPELREWMKTLPKSFTFRFKGSSVRVVHGSVSSINQFIFASSPEAIKSTQIHEAGTDVVIGGHSGIPFGQKLGQKSWLNAGVIGMPANDGTADGWYMLLEAQAEGFNVTWQRLAYDARLASRTTRAAGMPAYAKTLTSGLWPGMDMLPATERHQQGQRLEPKSIQIMPVRSAS